MNESDHRLLQNAEGYLELNLPREAAAALARTSAAARATFEWTCLRAEAHRALEEYAAAVPFFEEAARHKPYVVAVYTGLGWCYKRTKQLAKAIEALHRAETVCAEGHEPENQGLVFYNLSCYYSLARDKERMLEYLDLALRKIPGFRPKIADEPDFDPFRDDADFQRLVRGQNVADQVH